MGTLARSLRRHFGWNGLRIGDLHVSIRAHLASLPLTRAAVHQESMGKKKRVSFGILATCWNSRHGGNPFNLARTMSPTSKFLLSVEAAPPFLAPPEGLELVGAAFLGAAFFDLGLLSFVEAGASSAAGVASAEAAGAGDSAAGAGVGSSVDIVLRNVSSCQHVGWGKLWLIR